jgi:high-affinity nickel-transport protein
VLEIGAVSGRTLEVGMLATAFVFGLRHGIDWDHLAAITDLVGSQTTPRRSMWSATCYALGHGAVVFALGIAAILFAERLPRSVDAVMERVVGATLLLLGVYVIVSLARHGREFRMRSRWMLVLAGIRRAFTSLHTRARGNATADYVVIEHDHPHRHDVDHGHSHVHAELTAKTSRRRADAQLPPTDASTVAHHHSHRHVLPVPDDPFAGPGSAAALGIGALHGVGAETPTQVVVFVGAAGASGAGAGLAMLVAFVMGVLASNTVIAAVATFGGITSSRRFPIYATISLITALFSLGVGALFLIGRASTLPTIFGG